MKLSISVMAHPKRKEFFQYLKRYLSNPPFSIDEGKGLIWNCRNAWSMYDPKADYHVVIQDDAIICKNFLKLAPEVLKKANGLPVSFFHVSPISYAKHRHQRVETGAIIQHGLSGGVALCLPTKLIPAMLAFYDDSKLPCDDHRVGTFLSTRKIPLYFPIPSLIDHRVGNASLCWKNESRHRANEFIDDPLRPPKDILRKGGIAVNMKMAWLVPKAYETRRETRLKQLKSIRTVGA